MSPYWTLQTILVGLCGNCVLGCASVTTCTGGSDFECLPTVRAELVQYGTEAHALDRGGFLEINFDIAPRTLSLADVSLTVQGDSFGRPDDRVQPGKVRFDWPYAGNPHVARIYLAKGHNLKIGGHASPFNTRPGSPSGLFIAASDFVDIADRRVRILQKEFDRYWRTYQLVVFNRVRSGDSCLDNYALSYDLEGLLSMYEATRSTRYLSLAMEIANTMLAGANDMDGDGYLDFRGTTHTLGEQRTFNIALCDWKAGRPIARLARLLGENEAIAEHVRYRAFVGEHLVEKWSRSLNQRPEKMFLPTSVQLVEADPLIHRVAHYGDILVDAWLDSRTPRYESVLDALLHKVCSDLQDSAHNPGAVEWDIFMKPKESAVDIVRDYKKPYVEISDTSHANGTVSFLVAAALRADKTCPGRDAISDLAFTFRNVIVKMPDTSGESGIRFADFVDGGVLADGQAHYSIGRFIEDGWLKLGEVDSDIQAIAQRFYDQGLPVHRLQFLGNLARNYALSQWH